MAYKRESPIAPQNCMAPGGNRPRKYHKPGNVLIAVGKQETGATSGEMAKMVRSPEAITENRRKRNQELVQGFIAFCTEQAKIRQERGGGNFLIRTRPYQGDNFWNFEIMFYKQGATDPRESDQLFFCEFAWVDINQHPNAPDKVNPAGACIFLDNCTFRNPEDKVKFIHSGGRWSYANDLQPMVSTARTIEGILKSIMFTTPNEPSIPRQRRRFFWDRDLDMENLENSMRRLINPETELQGSGGVGARAGLLSQSLCMLHSRICELEHVLI